MPTVHFEYFRKLPKSGINQKLLKIELIGGSKNLNILVTLRLNSVWYLSPFHTKISFHIKSKIMRVCVIALICVIRVYTNLRARTRLCVFEREKTIICLSMQLGMFSWVCGHKCEYSFVQLRQHVYEYVQMCECVYTSGCVCVCVCVCVSECALACLCACFYFWVNFQQFSPLNFLKVMSYIQIQSHFLIQISLKDHKWMEAFFFRSKVPIGQKRLSLSQKVPQVPLEYNSRTNVAVLDATFCSDISWGGRNYILKWVFFVQSIFADRYIHRRELRLVSLERSSSVEYRIKKIFLFSLSTGSYRG